MNLYTLIIFTEDKPGILYRIADAFLKRKMNITSLTVSDMEHDNMSRFTVVVNADKTTIEKVAKQLYKIIEVIKVIQKTDEELLFREIALFKVTIKNKEQQKEVENFCTLLTAKIDHVGKESMIIEKSGTEEEIDSLYNRLKPYGLKEYVRSGRIALIK